MIRDVHDYDDSYDPDGCDHEEYEIDVLIGRAECQCCPHAWYVGHDELNLALDRHAAYWEEAYRHSRWYWRLFDRVRNWWATPWLHRRAGVIDDDLPF